MNGAINSSWRVSSHGPFAKEQLRRRAQAGRAVDDDIPAMQVADPFDQGQAYAGALRIRAAIMALKDALQVRLVDAFAGIADDQAAAFQTNVDLAGLGMEYGIADQVTEFALRKARVEQAQSTMGG